MKTISGAMVLFLLFTACQREVTTTAAVEREAASANVMDPEDVEAAEAADRVVAGDAVLVDVREPEEWESGVAAPAHLLPLSDLQGDREQWNGFLSQLDEGKELILYCRTGNRSGIAAGILAEEGFETANAGGFRDWQAAGLPERSPADERITPEE